MKEKRKYSRIKKSLPIKLSAGEFDIVTETKDISASGAYCSVDKPMEVMTKLSIVILVPVKGAKVKAVKKINCQGVVVRKEYVRDNGAHYYNMGIFFNEIEDRDRKALLSFINSTQKGN